MDEWWPLVADHIQRWLAFDGIWTVDGVKEEIKAARAQLWCVYKDRIICVCVTRVDETDSVRLGLVWGCGGDFMTHKEDSKAFLRVIEGWFRELGCQFVEWSGREGWAKIFTDYKRHAVVLRKRL